MTNHRLVEVRRLFRVVNGGTPTNEPVNWDGGVQWATPVDLGLCDGATLQTTQRTLTAEGLRTGSSEVQDGSLILSSRAPIGYIAQTKAPSAFNQGCKGLVPRSDLDIRYYRFVLTSQKAALTAAGQGSTFVELSSEAVASFRVPHPALSTQGAIADYLDTETGRIDALIARKQALSVSLDMRWRGELLYRLGVAGEPTDGAVPWVGTPLPSDWSLRPLRRLIARSWGGDWGSDPGAGVVDLQCVRAADFDFPNLRAVSGPTRAYDAKTLGAKLLRAGDMVVEKSGGGEGVPVGRVVAWRGEAEAVPTNFAAGLRPAPDADPVFVLLAFRAAYEAGLPWRSIKQTTGLQNLDMGHYLGSPD